MTPLVETREKILSKIDGGNDCWPLNIESISIYDTYRQIGYKYMQPIQEIAVKIFNDPERKKTRVERANTALSSLKSLAADSNFTDSYLAEEYLYALQAWADGAGISLKAAAVLQDDNTGGCQTCAIRISNNQILLAHTEEESFDIDRISGPPVISLNLNNEKQITMAYPDLLPGSSTFSATEKSIVACDYLWLNPIDNGRNFINSLTWMIWRMGQNASPIRVENLIKKMQPFVDGLAITVAKESPDGNMEAYKIQCAGDQFATEYLGPNSGDNLYQVTIINPEDQTKFPALYRLALPEAELNKFSKYTKYIERLEKFKKLFNAESFKKRVKYLESLPAEDVHRLAHNFLSSTNQVSDGWDFANSAVVAAGTSLLIKGNGNSVSINLGAAERHDTEFTKYWP